MNWYIYNDEGKEIAIIYASGLLTAVKEAKVMGFGGYAIERA